MNSHTPTGSRCTFVLRRLEAAYAHIIAIMLFPSSSLTVPCALIAKRSNTFVGIGILFCKYDRLGARLVGKIRCRSSLARSIARQGNVDSYRCSRKTLHISNARRQIGQLLIAIKTTEHLSHMQKELDVCRIIIMHQLRLALFLVFNYVQQCSAVFNCLWRSAGFVGVW